MEKKASFCSVHAAHIAHEQQTHQQADARPTALSARLGLIAVDL